MVYSLSKSRFVAPATLAAVALVTGCDGENSGTADGAGTDGGLASGGTSSASAGGSNTGSVGGAASGLGGSVAPGGASGTGGSASDGGASAGDPDGGGATQPDAGGAPADGGAPEALVLGPADSCGDHGVTVLADIGSYFGGAIASDDDYVYYDEHTCNPLSVRWCVSATGPLYRVPRCGGTPEHIGQSPDSTIALLDGKTVLYEFGTNLPLGVQVPALSRIHKDTLSVDVLPAPASMLVAANSHDFVYWDQAAHGFGAIAVGSLFARLLGSVAVDAVALAVTEDHLFWSDSHDLWRASLGSAFTPERLAEAVYDYTAAFLYRAEGDSVFASIDRDVFGLPGTGAATGPRVVDYPPYAWDSGFLFADENIRSHRTTRLADHGNGTPEVVLRTNAANVVKNGTMYWGSDRYILKRAAAPESIPDPLDPARDRPDWTVDVALHVADNIQPLPNGSVVISGMMPDPQKPQGAELVLELPFLDLYSSTGQKLKSLPVGPSTQINGLGGDPSGGFVALHASIDERHWVRYDASGNETGLGGIDLPTSYFTVGPSGRMVAWSWRLSDEPTALHVLGPDGAIVKSQTIGTASMNDAAVSPTDRVFAAGTATKGQTFFGQTADVDGGFVAFLDAAGSVTSAIATPGLNVTRLGATADGGVVLLGESRGRFVLDGDRTVAVPGRDNGVLARLDASGKVKWLRSFEGTAYNLGVDARDGVSIAGSPTEDYFVDLLSSVHGARTDRGYLARFDPNGKLLEVLRSDEPTFGALAVRADGAAFVTTSSWKLVRFGPKP